MNNVNFQSVLAGHQPNFLPWIGYFEKISNCDIFVFADDVQYPKQSYTNRTRVNVGGREQYAGLAVKGPSDQKIADKLVVKSREVEEKLYGTLAQIRNESAHPDDVEGLLQVVMTSYVDSAHLCEINISVIKYVMSRLGIETQCAQSSALELKVSGPNERIIERCRRLGARTYLAGSGSADYLRPHLFQESGIRLSTLRYQLPSALMGDRSHLSIVNAVADYGFPILKSRFLQQRGSKDDANSSD